MDTSNIPYIDEESSDSRNNSVRNSRCIEIDTKTLIVPNYIVEKHVIYNQNTIEEDDRKQIRGEITGIKGVKEFIQGFGGSINIEDLNTNSIGQRHDDVQLNIEIDPRMPERDFEGTHIDFKNQEIDLNAPDIKGGIKGFFKGVGGKLKPTEIQTNEKEIKIKQPKTNVKEPKIETTDIKIETLQPKCLQN